MCWILFWDMCERNTPAAPQSNLSCLEINDISETATGRAKLGQHFYTKIMKKTNFSKESSDTIRIEMHCLILILLTFEISK